MKSVLVVEDDFANRSLVEMLMRRGGWQVAAAADADEAWRLFLDNPPDLVVTDIGLPGKSGVELLRDIRANRPQVAVVALTADWNGGEELKRAGFDDVWDKPFDSDKLERAKALIKE